MVVESLSSDKAFTRRRRPGSQRPSPPCGLSCGAAGLRPQRSVARNLQRHMQMLDRDVSTNYDCLEGCRCQLTLFASVAVHMRLQGRRASKSLVADLALVLLLGVRGHLGAKLAHHRLRARRRTACQKTGGPGKSARFIRFGSR